MDFARLIVLKQQLANLETAHAELPITCTPKTPQEKVALFRHLFRGREDIFTKRWKSRSGKKGDVEQIALQEVTVSQVIGRTMRGCSHNEHEWFFWMQA